MYIKDISDTSQKQAFETLTPHNQRFHENVTIMGEQ